MKRTLYAIILCVLVFGSLAGCHAATQSPPAPAPAIDNPLYTEEEVASLLASAFIRQHDLEGISRKDVTYEGNHKWSFGISGYKTVRSLSGRLRPITGGNSI